MLKSISKKAFWGSRTIQLLRDRTLLHAEFAQVRDIHIVDRTKVAGLNMLSEKSICWNEEHAVIDANPDT